MSNTAKVATENTARHPRISENSAMPSKVGDMLKWNQIPMSSDGALLRVGTSFAGKYHFSSGGIQSVLHLLEV
jgi:hypothetical protein